MQGEVLFWSWRALYKTRTGRDSWRTLRWKMSEEDAAKWAADKGTHVEKLEGSSELRCVGEPYRGWGEAFPDRS